jgi:hypothetical protein
VSKVFHSLPQVQNHLSSLRGDQPQSGQRMREPEESPLLSSSSSRSNTTDDLEISFKGVCTAEHVGFVLERGQPSLQLLPRGTEHDFVHVHVLRLADGEGHAASE